MTDRKTKKDLKFRVDLLSLLMEFASNVTKCPKPVFTIGVSIIYEKIGKIASLGLSQDSELFDLCNDLGFYNPQNWDDITNVSIKSEFKRKGVKYPY